MTYKTLIRMETTDEIRDGVKRTGDLLNRVIGILGLETKTLSVGKRGRRSDRSTFSPNGPKERVAGTSQ